MREITSRYATCVGWFRLLALVFVGASVGACAQTRPLSPNPTETVADPGPRSGRTVATIDGTAISDRALWAHLGEAAGGRVLEELALEHALKRELERVGLMITENDVREEERRLVELLVDRSGATDDQAVRGVERARAARGLGPARYRSLLRRNAMLRALAAPRVVVTEADLQDAYRIRYGERLMVRLIVTRTRAEAALAADRIIGGEAVALVAIEMSTDPSALRAGMVGPLSLVDPSYPPALRNALVGVEPGALTPIIALDEGFALASIDRVIPGESVGFEGVRALLEREVRLARERVVMDAIGRELLGAARVTPLDPSLGWSWDQTPRAETP